MKNRLRKALSFANTAFFSRRGLLILAGTIAVIYSITILFYVQSIPDLGLRSAFSTAIMGQARTLPGALQPLEQDEVVKVGDIAIKTWVDLLNAPFQLRGQLAATASLPS